MFENKKILIIGDVMLDTYIYGTVERISPEAPVPVINVEKRINKLGGAANVAMNIKNLGSEPILCSIIGNDINGDLLKTILKEKEINTEYIFKSDDRKTTCKNRLIGNNTQIGRFDDESTYDLDYNDYKKIERNLEIIIDREDIDVILMQDYEKGVIDRNMIDKIIRLSKTEKIPVVVDPKKNNFSFYKDIKLIKPNFKEFKNGVGLEKSTMDMQDIIKEGSKILHKRGVENLFITLGSEGIYISYDYGKKHRYISGIKRNVSDVSGAGDTVISVISTLICNKQSIPKIANISNIAGGLVCEHIGVIPIDKDRLLKEIKKIK